MVLTFTVILLGLLLLIPPLKKNSFYMVHAGWSFWPPIMWKTAGLRSPPFIPKPCFCSSFFSWPRSTSSPLSPTAWTNRAAQKGDWRVPESNLHTLEFLGGWAGALLGQKFFHHKSKKRSYQTFFWMMMLFEAALVFVILRFLHII